MVSWIILSLVIFVGLAWFSRPAGLWVVLAGLSLYLVKFEVGLVPTTLLEMFIYIIAIVFIVKNYQNLGSMLASTFRPIWLPLALLLVGLIIGSIVSPNLRLSLGIFKGWFVDPIILYFLVVNIIDWRKIEHFVMALILSTLPMSGLAIWQAATQNFITVDGRASAWFVSANYLSMYLVPIMILGIVLVVGRSWIYRWAAGVILLIDLVALYFSFSYGGWLALLGALLVLVLIHFRRHWKIWIWGALVPIIGVVSQFGSDRFVKMLDLGERSSVSVRIQVWQTGLLMIKENWLTGVGLGMFRDKYLEFANRLGSSPWETAILHAHSLLGQFVINLGVVGLVGFVWLVIKFFLWLRTNLNLASVILMSAMSAILIHGLIDSTYWKNDLSALFWIVMAFAFLRWRELHNNLARIGK